MMTTERIPESLARVQHAIELSIDKSCAKEPVVALKWSGNENILKKMLNATRPNGKFEM